MIDSSTHEKWISFFALFTSTGTLICCALPALFVTLGMGATFAGLLGNVPQLIWFSENKNWVFAISGILIFSSALLQYRNRNAPCPIDSKLAAACIKGRKYSARTLGLSAVIWLIGAFFGFVAPYI
ncbi:MAG: hypothetical protein KDD25_06145 [Bdellovibrionales bacterium]|nr:hypothetical protein [Bdellovibrionales bacterium]